MPDLPMPAATRLRRPSWRDARLLVGLLLVLTSTVLGSLVVAAADDRVPVYVAGHALVPGERIDAGDLTPARVRLDRGVAGYLPADRPVPPGAVAVRAVADHELVPASAIGSPRDLSVQALSLRVDSASVEGLARGTVVDVYVNLPREGGTGREFTGPRRSVESATVMALGKESGGLAAAGGTRTVTLSVPSEAVSELIGGVDSGARVTLVPAPGAP